MQCGTVRALEIGRPAGVDVEPAAAAAPQFLFDRLNVGVGVESRGGFFRTTRPLWIVNATHRLTVGLLDGLTDGQKKASCREQETATIDPVRPSDRPTVRHRSASNFTV